MVPGNWWRVLCGRCAGVETGVLLSNWGLFKMQLSAHFTLEEMTISGAAARAGLINAPSELQILHLKTLCSLLEIVRQILGEPLLVHSGFRSVEVNKLVSGVPNSAHLQGYAADFICPNFGPPIVVARKLASSLKDFDQLIYEYDSWVHLSADPQDRRQILRIVSDGRGYQKGLERDPLVA